MDKKWRLYDSEKKVFFNNLDRFQLSKILEGIDEPESKNWYICQEDEDDWHPLELEQMASMNSNERPSGIVSLGTFVGDIINQDTKTDLKTKSKLVDIDKRRVTRYREKIELFIDVGDQIISCTTKDMSLVTIRLDKRYPIKYSGRFYPLTLKTKPPMTLRCTPMVGEKEHIRGEWNIVKLDPAFNIQLLAEFLSERRSKPRK